MNYDGILESNTFFTPESVSPLPPSAYATDTSPTFGSLYAQDPVQADPQAIQQPNQFQKFFTQTNPNNPYSTPFISSLQALANIFPQNRAAGQANQELFASIEQGAQRKRAEERQAKLDDQQAAIRGLDLMAKGGSLQGASRKAYFDQLRNNFLKLTGSDDTTIIDTFEKSKDEETKLLADGLRAYMAEAGLGMKDIPGLAEQDPEFFLKVNELGLRAQKQKNEVERTKLLQQAIGRANEEGDTPQGELVPPPQPQPQTQPQTYRIPGKAGGPTLADRHNNPLNIKLGPATAKWVHEGQAVIGEPGQDGGRFLKFTNAAVGFNAAQDLLSKPIYANSILDTAMRKWSNNGYGADVAPNLPPTTRIGDLSSDQKAQLIQAMAKREGYTGAPSTRAVAEQATDEDRQALQTNKQTMQRLSRAIKVLQPFSDDPGVSRQLNQLQEERKFAQSEVSRIENRYDKNKPTQSEEVAARRLGYDQPWSQLSKEERQNATDLAPAIEAKDAALKSKMELEATAPIKKEIAEAGNPSQPIKNINEYRFADGSAVPAGWTMADVKEANEKAKAEGLPEAIYQVTKMPEKAEADGESHLAGLRAARRVIDMSKDPAVQKLIGNFFSNPEGSITVALHQVFGKDIPPQYTEVAAELAGLTSEILHAKLGANQTVREFKRIQPLIAQLSDPTATDVAIKMRVLHDQMAEEFNNRLRGYRKRKYDYNPEWEEQPILRDKVAETSDPSAQGASPAVGPTGKQRNPLAEAVEQEQQRREALRKGRK